MTNQKALFILPHLMEKNGRLGIESISRINESISIFKKNCFNFLITSGWNYRKDSKLMIGEVMAGYIIKNFKIDRNKILIDNYSRDTVGDAFFVREQFMLPKNIVNLTIVTSDWHVERTKVIFKKFLKKNFYVNVIGIFSNKKNDDYIKRKEILSLNSFFKTFENVDLFNKSEVISTLKKKHPLYNGDINEQITFP